MKPEFICANHREWLRGHPVEAYNWWEKSLDAGKYHQEMHQWNESIRPLGCAFDAAAIIIEHANFVESNAIDRLSIAAQCLIYSLLKVGQHNFAHQIVGGVQVLVNSLDKRALDRPNILDMQRKLHLCLATSSTVMKERSENKIVDIRKYASNDNVVSIH